MRAQHIKHELLDPVEYYFCDFRTEQDIKAFEKTCPWFEASELSIEPGDCYVIKHNTSEIGGYYEKLPAAYFINQIQKLAGIYSEIYTTASQFF